MALKDNAGKFLEVSFSVIDWSEAECERCVIC